MAHLTGLGPRYPLNVTGLGPRHPLRLMVSHLEVEDNRRGLRPQLPPAHRLRTDYRLAEAQSQHVIKGDPERPNIMISNRVYPSMNSFSSLKRTNIDQLYLEISAVGKYVIIRVLEQGYEVVGWSTLVEDDLGNVCFFTVYNYPPQELFPAGTVLILKEPYFKMGVSGYQALRCDCPTDIIVLRPSHPLFHMSQGIQWKNELCESVADPLFRPPVPAGANRWKERGNALYNQKQLILAREAYQLGLQKCQKTSSTFKLLQSNLTAVNLELGYFEMVIKIAKDILLKFPNEKKVLFRAGKAHYELRQYKEALNYFEKLHHFYPKDDEGRIELKRAQHRVQEMETGRVSIKRLQRKMAKAPTKEIDCADYVGPVKVIAIPGKGRGVVLTEDVEAQTILMVSKALAVNFDFKQSSVMEFDPSKTLQSNRHQMTIVTKLAQLVTKNPTTMGPLVYALSTGVEPREEIKLYCDPETKEEPICDVEKIRAICKLNIFEIGYDYGEEDQCDPVGIGLFLLPSYLNHSCVPNVTRTFYNDVMIVRAAQSLKIGDELCTHYVPIAFPYKERAELIAFYGFICKCSLCESQM